MTDERWKVEAGTEGGQLSYDGASYQFMMPNTATVGALVAGLIASHSPASRIETYLHFLVTIRYLGGPPLDAPRLLALFPEGSREYHLHGVVVAVLNAAGHLVNQLTKTMNTAGHELEQRRPPAPK